MNPGTGWGFGPSDDKILSRSGVSVVPGVVGVNGVSSGVDADAVAIGVGAIDVADTDVEDDE